MNNSTIVTKGIYKPFKSIYIPENYNIRHDLPDIPELAADLAVNGQLTPVVVSNGGTKDKPLILRAGFRRCAAFIYNKWEDRDILVTIREYKSDDHIAPFIDCWTENQREPIHPLDVAEFIYRLATGTYWVPESVTAKPIDRETISNRFRISSSHVGKYLKVFKNIHPEISHEARKENAPLRLLITLSNIESEGLTKQEKEENKLQKQKEIFQFWTNQKKELEEQGRKRTVRSDKGQKRTESETESENEEENPVIYIPPINPNKKIGIKNSSLHRPVRDYLIVLQAKQVNASKEDKLKLDGMIDSFRFMMGLVKKLPGVVASDFDSLEE